MPTVILPGSRREDFFTCEVMVSRLLTDERITQKYLHHGRVAGTLG